MLLRMLAIVAMSLSLVACAESVVTPPLDVSQVEDVNQIEREGVRVNFTATPARSDRAGIPAGIVEGEFADIEFRIMGAEDGQPLQGIYPGVWIDLTQTAEGQTKGVSLDCKTRVGQYLQGLVGMRPMIDLNSYYVLVLNRDASISIIDPVVGITGTPLNCQACTWLKPWITLLV